IRIAVSDRLARSVCDVVTLSIQTNGENSGGRPGDYGVYGRRSDSLIADYDLDRAIRTRWYNGQHLPRNLNVHLVSVHRIGSYEVNWRCDVIEENADVGTRSGERNRVRQRQRGREVGSEDRHDRPWREWLTGNEAGRVVDSGGIHDRRLSESART